MPRPDGVIAADVTSSAVSPSEGQGIWGLAFPSQPILPPLYRASWRGNGTPRFQVHGDGSLAGSGSAPILSVSRRESFPVLSPLSAPDPPVKGRDLPALRLVNLYGRGTPMERCCVGQGFPRNRSNSGGVYVEESYFKELAYIVMEAGECEVCRVGLAGWRPKEELVLQLESKGHLRAEFLLLGEGQHFCSLHAFS